MGVIVPKTSDGRLIYAINYLGYPMVGTTDDICEPTHFVGVEQKDEDFILKEYRAIVGEDYDYDKTLKSKWAGIRPLVKAGEESVDTGFRKKIDKMIKNAKNTVQGKTGSSSKNLVRDHVVEISPEGLVSLMGGKWTSFR